MLVVTKSFCGYVSNTHTNTHSHIHTKSPRFLAVFFRIFSIFDSFHFLNCLMIVVLQKNPWNPGVAVKIPWFKYLSIYLSVYNYNFVSQFPPTRFPLLTAIGMFHFLPAHHLEWHFGPGRRSKYNIRSPTLHTMNRI